MSDMARIRVGTAGLQIAIDLFQPFEFIVVNYGTFYEPATLEIPRKDLRTFQELHADVLDLLGMLHEPKEQFVETAIKAALCA